jgi:hypothetical protein
MPDESSVPAKSTKEEIKEQSPQVILATALAGISQLLPDKQQAKILAVLAPVISLVFIALFKYGVSGIAALFHHFTEETDTEVSSTDAPLDVLLKRYIRENKREARWMMPFSKERQELGEARAQLRRRLHAYQMGELPVSVNVVATTQASATSQQALPPVPPS